MCPSGPLASWEIRPRRGVGPLELGASRSEIRAAMERQGLALESERATLDYFSNSCLQVEYAEDGTAQFIGLFCDPRFAPGYQGLDVFGVSARRLFSVLAAADGGTHVFAPSGYLFPEQIIALSDASSQYNYRLGGREAVWMQVGLGSEQYLSAVRALRSSA